MASSDRKVRRRLAELGLLDGVAGAITLADWCDECLSDYDDKPSTKKEYARSKELLVDYFGEAVLLDEVGTTQAKAWVNWLPKQGGPTVKLKPANVFKIIRGAKRFFSMAVEADIITKSPFVWTKSPSSASQLEGDMTLEQATPVAESCPDTVWRVLLGLCRYAGCGEGKLSRCSPLVSKRFRGCQTMIRRDTVSVMRHVSARKLVI